MNLVQAQNLKVDAFVAKNTVFKLDESLAKTIEVYNY